MKKVVAFALMLSAFTTTAHAYNAHNVGVVSGPPSYDCNMTPSTPEEFSKMANEGNAKAQKDLGCLYLEGRGVTKNFTEGKEWLSKSAEQGNADAQYDLGLILASPGDISETVKWLRKASDQGHSSAEVALGFFYFYGLGVKKDETVGKKLLLNQAEKGNAYAQNILGCSYYSQAFWNTNSETVKWVRMAADQGLAKAQFNMGYFYFNGIGVKRDVEEAVKWWVMSANQGFLEAQLILGSLYENGDGVSKNAAEAINWYGLAAKNGSLKAQEALKRLNASQ